MDNFQGSDKISNEQLAAYIRSQQENAPTDGQGSGETVRNMSNFLSGVSGQARTVVSENQASNAFGAPTPLERLLGQLRTLPTNAPQTDPSLFSDHAQRLAQLRHSQGGVDPSLLPSALSANLPTILMGQDTSAMAAGPSMGSVVLPGSRAGDPDAGTPQQQGSSAVQPASPRQNPYAPPSEDLSFSVAAQNQLLLAQLQQQQQQLALLQSSLGTGAPSAGGVMPGMMGTAIWNPLTGFNQPAGVPPPVGAGGSLLGLMEPGRVTTTGLSVHPLQQQYANQLRIRSQTNTAPRQPLGAGSASGGVQSSSSDEVPDQGQIQQSRKHAFTGSNPILPPPERHHQTAEEPSIASNRSRGLRKKSDDRKPSRPLSAYNVFFKQERTRLLRWMEESGQAAPSSPAEERTWIELVRALPHDASEDVAVDPHSLATSSAVRNQRKKKPHGKISFKLMAKAIGQRWKDLPDPGEVRDYYNKIAAADMVRYREEQVHYKNEMMAQQRLHGRGESDNADEKMDSSDIAAGLRASLEGRGTASLPGGVVRPNMGGRGRGARF